MGRCCVNVECKLSPDIDECTGCTSIKHSQDYITALGAVSYKNMITNHTWCNQTNFMILINDGHC